MKKKHTVSRFRNIYDVNKLYEIVRDKEVFLIPTKIFVIEKGKDTGFSLSRQRKVNFDYPIIMLANCIDIRDALLDGKHRVAKAKDYGRDYILVRFVNRMELEHCLVK